MTLEGLRLGKYFSLIGAITLCAFTGCASSTVLQTQPPGATVAINGAIVGRTPYTLTDTKVVGSSTPIRFEYPGYAPLDVTLTRNEEVDVLPLIGGLFVLVPFLWGHEVPGEPQLSAAARDGRVSARPWLSARAGLPAAAGLSARGQLPAGAGLSAGAGIPAAAGSERPRGLPAPAPRLPAARSAVTHG
jgi:hypothetical protein